MSLKVLMSIAVRLGSSSLTVRFHRSETGGSSARVIHRFGWVGVAGRLVELSGLD
jgi:hypothetical protein